ncbi:Hypothetical cytosolic protein [Bacillus thuringiensis serovar israelensis ATCC 35646]|nr:Hypothetical cytosolic protein [Bacillus thuringiensis serovar israelensis ATCC 35646]
MLRVSPIGPDCSSTRRPITEEMIDTWIQEIEDLPHELTKAIKDLDQKQLDTPYRVGGWTVRQVVHHVVDSHMNSYIRFKVSTDRKESNY